MTPHAFEQRWMHGVTLAVMAVASSSCGLLLGGLDEGTARTARPEPAVAPADGGSARPPGCAGWLPGFRHRMRLSVKHEGGELRDMQIKVALPTGPLVRAGRLREDRVDLRVTAADGTTPLPYWRQTGPVTDVTSLWTKMDLEPGENSAWVYYGRPDASDESSLERTFVSGVVDAPTFDRPDAWTERHGGFDETGPSRTSEWSVSFAPGMVTLKMVRNSTPSMGSALVELCQTVLFPAGAGYQIAVDVQVTLADNARAFVQPAPSRGWDSPMNALGAFYGADAESIYMGAESPGTTTLCLGIYGGADGIGLGAEATFSSLRVFRVKPGEFHPTFADALGPEETSCE